MTTEQTQILALSTDDRMALRHCTRVSFHLDSYNGPLIRATIEPPSMDARYTARQERLYPRLDTIEDRRHRDIVVTGQVIQFGQMVADDQVPNVGYELLASPRYNGVWQTVLSSLRNGDQVSLHFGADRFGSEITRFARVFVDALTLVVTRGQGEKAQRLEFLITVRAARNNSARMCRRVDL